MEQETVTLHRKIHDPYASIKLIFYICVPRYIALLNFYFDFRTLTASGRVKHSLRRVTNLGL